MKREKKKQRKHSTQLKFTRSFPAQGLSKLNKTTQAATYQTACMPGLFFYLPLMFVSVTEGSQSSVVSNIRKTFSMLRMHSLSLIKNIKRLYSLWENCNGRSRCMRVTSEQWLIILHSHMLLKSLVSSKFVSFFFFFTL